MINVLPLNSKTIFVKASPIMSKLDPCKFVSHYDKSRFALICHYCGEGHIRSKCFKLKNSHNIKLTNVLINNFSIENRIHPGKKFFMW